MKAQKVCINTKIYFYLAQLTRKPIIISTIVRVNNFIPLIHQTRNFIHHSLSPCFQELISRKMEAKSLKVDVEKVNGLSKASKVEPSQRRIGSSLSSMGFKRKETEKRKALLPFVSFSPTLLLRPFFFLVVLFSLLGFRFFSRCSSSPPTDYEV